MGERSDMDACTPKPQRAAGTAWQRGSVWEALEAEGQRHAAEEQRQVAEEIRQGAEALRTAAEEERQRAETRRQAQEIRLRRLESRLQALQHELEITLRQARHAPAPQRQSHSEAACAQPRALQGDSRGGLPP